MALASTAGVSKASIPLLLPCMIRGGDLAATNGPEPSNSWAGPTRGQGIVDLRCGSAFPSAREEMTTRVLGPAPVSC